MPVRGELHARARQPVPEVLQELRGGPRVPQPTTKPGTSFVSAHRAVKVHTSPTPNTPCLSAGTFFALA